jgi:serine/threonine-protein kinase
VTEEPSQLDALTAALADKYRIERSIGEGGMATVFLAHDLRHHREVALKVLRPELAEALGAQRFLKEIQVTANLQHPHILPLYDSGSAGGVLFYVMPLVRGESLRHRLTRESRLEVAEAVRIIQQVASALDFAHRQGVIHRDIKPENILLQDGEPLLADFGIALARAGSGESRLTGTGQSIGTVEYMSPEQAAGERGIDARSDIFSLAAVAYEMLAGHSPVHAPSAQAMLAKLMTEIPAPLAAQRHDVPAAIDDAIQRALRKDPSERFATAKEFRDALMVADTDRTRLRPTQGSRGRWGLAAGVVTAALLLVGGYALSKRGLSAKEAEASPIRSIAVLPLELLPRDTTQAYFAEGMTDELTTALATISALRVTSRGSAMQFPVAGRPATPVIAKSLNVDALLVGSVSRDGENVRIKADLIDARKDQQIWSKRFERKSSAVFALQADLAAAIAQEINVRVTSTEHARLSSTRTVNAAAHDAYLLGRYFFNRPSDENLHKAITQFEAAVRLDSTFAAGYSGLSDAYLWAGYNEGFLTATAGKTKSRVAAERAVQLDSNSAEAHTSLATYLAFYDKDWPACEREYRKAIALNPNYAFAHDQFGLALGFMGRADEAIAEGKRAAVLDPLSPQVLIDAALPYMYRQDSASANALARRAAGLDSTYFFPVMLEGWTHIDGGRYRESVPLLQKSLAMGAPPFVRAYLGYALGMSGDRAGALRQLDSIKAVSPGGVVLPFNQALIYLGIGDRKRALDNFERAYDADSQLLAWLGQDTMFDSLRTEPRFIALLRKLHFLK